MGSILAFDTATHMPTVALVRDGTVLGERCSQARRVLLDGRALMAEAGVDLPDLERVVVGTGPGSFTGVRIGIAAARGLALALDLPAVGVSTLAALAAGTPGAVPVIDAGRREVFTLADGEPVALGAGDLRIEPGTTCIGDGALRYRAALEASGAEVPPDDSASHLPWARLHASLSGSLAVSDLPEPVYVRAPDAKVSV
jgi:tRNA threonylcarbamoyladenosine biosynthesis protein TsaB